MGRKTGDKTETRFTLASGEAPHVTPWSFMAILRPVIGRPGSSKTPRAGPPCRKVAIDLQRRWEKTPGLIWEREGGEVNIEMERESDLIGLV